MTVCTLLLRPLSRATATFPAGANQIRLARRPKFGCRRRETFPAAAAAEFGATSWTEAQPLLVSLSMEHVVSTASVVTVGYFGAH